MQSVQHHKDDIIKYLLGDLPEAERSALEDGLFDDDEFFSQVKEIENDLIDDYLHRRLSSKERKGFERNYLSHPDRRERVKFIETFMNSLDTKEAGPAKSLWERLSDWIPRPAPMLVFASGMATLLAVLGASWLFFESRRLRQELNTAQVARAGSEQRERELQQQVAAQQKQSDDLAAEMARLRDQQQSAVTAPGAFSSIVSLLLSATGSRNTGSPQPERPPQLNLRPDTKSVRLKLKLKNNEYSSYQLILEEVGGGEVWSQKGIKPQSAKSGPIVGVTVPANKFKTGDYTLTLSGVTGTGDVDQIDAPFFRVRNK